LAQVLQEYCVHILGLWAQILTGMTCTILGSVTEHKPAFVVKNTILTLKTFTNFGMATGMTEAVPQMTFA
jgi:hypothetical protein